MRRFLVLGWWLAVFCGAARADVSTIEFTGFTLTNFRQTIDGVPFANEMTIFYGGPDGGALRLTNVTDATRLVQAGTTHMTRTYTLDFDMQPVEGYTVWGPWFNSGAIGSRSGKGANFLSAQMLADPMPPEQQYEKVSYRDFTEDDGGGLDVGLIGRFAVGSGRSAHVHVDAYFLTDIDDPADSAMVALQNPDISFHSQPPSVPEPGAWMLMLSGLTLVCCRRRGTKT